MSAPESRAELRAERRAERRTERPADAPAEQGERRVRTMVGTGVRMLLGVALAAGVVVAVASAVIAPWPTLGRDEVVPVRVVPDVATLLLACPGDPLVAGREAGNASALAIAAEANTVSGGAPAPNPIELSSSGGATGFAATAGEGGVPAAAAAQAATIAADDIVGFTATSCAPPRFESWLVGGATTTGQSALLTLTNPGDGAAVVDVTVFGGGDAPVQAPAGTGVAVPARTQLVLSLAGLAPGEANPVVRVVASGTPVAAALQLSTTQTLQPIGADIVGAAEAPTTAQLIPGAVVSDAVPAGFGALTVRVLAPERATTATVVAVPEGGGAPTTLTLPLEAGRPAETTFAELAPGRYTVRVSADERIVAAALGAIDGARDFAWFTAAEPLRSETIVAVPEGAPARLVVAATGDDAGAATLTPLGGGSAQRLEVTQGGQSSVELAPGLWRLAPEGAVAASVVFSGPGALAAFPVLPGGAQASPVDVFP